MSVGAVPRGDQEIGAAIGHQGSSWASCRKSHRFSISSKGSVIAERPVAGELDAADYILLQERKLKGYAALSEL